MFAVVHRTAFRQSAPDRPRVGRGARVRGEILQFDEASGEGLISGDDGQRYRLSFRDLIRPARLFAGQSVDFLPRDGFATDVVVLQAAPASSAYASPRTERQGKPELGPWGYFMKSMRLYVDGNGRARRSEYWWFTLFYWVFLLIPLVPAAVLVGMGENAYDDNLIAFGGVFFIVAGIVWLALFLPNVCVMIRRFHDVGLTGWLVLLGVIPYIGGLITFIITLLPSQNYRNVHGPVPGGHSRETAEVFG